MRTVLINLGLLLLYVVVILQGNDLLSFVVLLVISFCSFINYVIEQNKRELVLILLLILVTCVYKTLIVN